MSPPTLLTIHWADDLPDSEIVRLSRAWAATINAKPVVNSIRIQVLAPKLAPRGRGRPRLERRRYQLTRSAVARHEVNFVRFTVGARSDENRWCYGCAATIPAGEPHARDANSSRVCMACIEAAIPE